LNTTPSPELSVLLVTDRAATIREVIRRYLEQSGEERVEIVVAALPGARLDATTLGAETFARVRIVAVDTYDLGRAEALAVHAACAPRVLFAQAHAFPRDGFLDAMLAAFESGRWAIVGPEVVSANPDSAASWAGMLLHYGAGQLPGHFSAYDRERLLELGDRMEALLDVGFALQEAVRARGGRDQLAAGACIEIVNVSHFGWFLVDQFAQSAKFAADRRLAWSVARRLLYTAGFPLIPFVRFARILSDLRRQRRLRELPPRLHALLAGLIASALGEAVGYTVGNLTEGLRADMALHRLDYLGRSGQAAPATRGGTAA
jgi:hypothetical protein